MVVTDVLSFCWYLTIISNETILPCLLKLISVDQYRLSFWDSVSDAMLFCNEYFTKITGSSITAKATRIKISLNMFLAFLGDFEKYRFDLSKLRIVKTNFWVSFSKLHLKYTEKFTDHSLVQCQKGHWSTIYCVLGNIFRKLLTVLAQWMLRPKLRPA